jgi:hypothetical protein
MVEADKPGSLTIEDIAHLAGVSVSSARNYFSRPELLSAPTHARIKAVVAPGPRQSRDSSHSSDGPTSWADATRPRRSRAGARFPW